MKKSQLLYIVCALILFAMTSGANAAIIAIDVTSITRADQSHTQPFAVSPASFSGELLTLDVLGGADQIHDEGFNCFTDSNLSESLHTDSHKSLWLLLIVASVFGIISEISHRISFNR